LEAAGVTASGVLAVVDANMVRALRRVTVARGVDPTGLALVAFGGAGPLHACALADALGMPAIVIPARAGVLSAVGMLAAPRQVDLVRGWAQGRDYRGAEAALRELAAEAVRQLGSPDWSSSTPGGGDAPSRAVLGGARPGRAVPSRSTPGGESVTAAGGAAAGGPADAVVVAPAYWAPAAAAEAVRAGRGVSSEAAAVEPAVAVETRFDCRYVGQGHELTVGTIGRFPDEHLRRNGFARPGLPVEVVALRATARLASPVRLVDIPDPGGRTGSVIGPAVIEEPDCTVWVADGWTARVGGGGAWVLTRTAAARRGGKKTQPAAVPPGGGN
jgi:N-methylhydantoinase A/oxoprolinase/acetone carboxylase beta subunit